MTRRVLSRCQSTTTSTGHGGRWRSDGTSGRLASTAQQTTDRATTLDLTSFRFLLTQYQHIQCSSRIVINFDLQPRASQALRFTRYIMYVVAAQLYACYMAA